MLLGGGGSGGGGGWGGGRMDNAVRRVWGIIVREVRKSRR